MKRIPAIILALLLLSGSVLTACSEQPSNENNSDVQNSTSDTDAQPSESAVIEEDNPLYADLPTKDYDGYTFRFLTSASNYGITYMDVEGMTGDIINDTVYERNRAIEKELDIVVYEEGGLNYDQPSQRLVTMVTAGDDEFDVIFSEANFTASLASDNYMYNLYDIPDINWDKPWWEESIREFFDIGGKLYFTYSPMHLHYYESLVTPLFNKTIANNYQVENLYDAVREGTWTLDKMVSISQNIVTDLNGDGKMSPEDDLYALCYSGNLIISIPLASDCRYTQIGENGIPQFSGAQEKLVSIMEKLSGLLGNPDNYIEYGDYIRLFQENHSLFFMDVLGRVKDFRSLDADFGILPLPKYDEAQEKYISSNYRGAALLVVPTSNRSYQNIGPILETFSAYSYRDLIPAYYEKNIQGKQTRDEESVEMLEIMLSNITGDLAVIYDWGSIDNLILTAAKKGEGIASSFRATGKAVNKAIENWYQGFED